jgi:hypothetical protein
MTILTTQSRVTYAGDGVTVNFSVPFEFFLNTDLTVQTQTAAGVVTNLVYGVDYLLSGAGSASGGSLTKTVALALGTSMAIFLNPPIAQQSHYVSNATFPAATLENDLDRQTQISARLQDQISRALRTPDSDANSAAPLPPAAQRANTALIFDSSGRPSVGALSSNLTTKANVVGLLQDSGYRYQVHPAESAVGLTAWSLTFGFDPLDIRRYGGDPTGVTLSDTALATALSVIGSTGGRVRFPGPNALYKVANQYSVNSTHGITFEGDATPGSAATNGTVLLYTGTAAPWISAAGASGFLIANMSLQHSNASFTGRYVKYGAVGLSPASFCGLRNASVGSPTSNTIHLDLDETITFSAEGCLFIGGNPSISGQGYATFTGSISGTTLTVSGGIAGPTPIEVGMMITGAGISSSTKIIALGTGTGGVGTYTVNNSQTVGSEAMVGLAFSNVVGFKNCEWTSSGPNGSLAYGGQAWTFENCDLEATSAGVAQAFGTTTQAPCDGLTFKGCWFGDVTSGSGTFISFSGHGLSITGCYAAGSATSNFVQLTSASGVNIAANSINAFNGVVAFADANCQAVVAAPNFLSGIGSLIINPANAPANLVYNPNYATNISSPLAPPAGIGAQANNGFRTDVNGVLEQWGQATVTTGTPLAVLFATNGKNYASAPWVVQVTVVTPSGANNTAYVTLPANTGFTLNVNGTAGSNTVYWRSLGI